MPPLCHYENTCFAWQNSSLCLNSLFVRVFPPLSLSVQCSGRCVCRATKGSNLLLSLVVFMFCHCYPGILIGRGHFLFSFFFQLSLTRIRMHVWRKSTFSHKMTVCCACLRRNTGLCSNALLDDFCFNKEPPRVSQVTLCYITQSRVSPSELLYCLNSELLFSVVERVV